MDEFALIDFLTAELGATRGALGGIGDDAVVLDVPEGKQLVVSTDTLVEGIHFEAGTAPADIGYKSLAVNLSDLAAMGAQPAWYFLSLTLPSMERDWVRGFASGIKGLAEEAGIALVGGDTTSGPLNVTVTVCGLVEPGMAMLRSGARVGDVIGISGPTGLAGCALRDRQSGRAPSPSCAAALDRPIPRLGLGKALSGLVSSCIDISDGLLADLGHISDASCVGARLELASLPISPELADLPDESRWELQLSAGDDYELCFTAAPGNWDEVRARASAVGADATAIGEIVVGDKCVCVMPGGEEFRPGSRGFIHGNSG